jgi:hypothetical protein
MCRHEMRLDWCAFCLGQVSRQSNSEPSEDFLVSSPFPARYKIRCDECEEDILPGDMVCVVHQHPDDLGDIVHEDCVVRGIL